MAHDQLAAEFQKNYLFIANILKSFNLKISRLVCALHDPSNPKKYHPDKNLWDYSENLLVNSLNELNLDYTILRGEAAFYGPKLDIEVQTSDEKNITLSTIQLDFILPQKFGLKYIDKEQKLQTPVIIHHAPASAYQRFIALLLEQTGGKLPFWLAPHQVAILPLNEEKEIKEYCKRLEKELTKNNLRVKTMTEKTLNYRIRQVYKKKIPYYLVIGKEELKKEKLKLVYTYQSHTTELINEEELIRRLLNHCEKENE